MRFVCLSVPPGRFEPSGGHNHRQFLQIICNFFLDNNLWQLAFFPKPRVPIRLPPTVSHGWQTQGMEALHVEGSLAIDARRASLLRLDCSGSAARWSRVNTRRLHAWQFASLCTEHGYGPTPCLAGGIPSTACCDGACLPSPQFLSRGAPASFSRMVQTIGTCCCSSRTRGPTGSLGLCRVRGPWRHAR